MKGKRLFAVFAQFFALSLFVLGGGYVIIAVADRVLSRKGWTRKGELVDMIPVFQTIPGIMAGHCAVYVGGRIAGALGAAAAVAGAALPSVVIFTLVAMYGADVSVGGGALGWVFILLRTVLVYFVAAAVVRSWKSMQKDFFSCSILLLSFVAAGLMKLPVVAVLLVMMAAGLVSVCAAGRSRRFMTPAWISLLVFLKYGLLGFGGGFALVPMYIEDFVGPTASLLQIDMERFSSLIAFAQATPGPIGINAATFFGYSLAGVAGAVLASTFVLLPGSFIGFFAFRSLERFKESMVVRGIMRGARPAGLALMSVALWVFVDGTVGSVSDCLARRHHGGLSCRHSTQVCRLSGSAFPSSASSMGPVGRPCR